MPPARLLDSGILRFQCAQRFLEFLQTWLQIRANCGPVQHPDTPKKNDPEPKEEESGRSPLLPFTKIYEGQQNAESERREIPPVNGPEQVDLELHAGDRIAQVIGQTAVRVGILALPAQERDIDHRQTSQQSCENQKPMHGSLRKGGKEKKSGGAAPGFA
jgi:hypothetical protein